MSLLKHLAQTTGRAVLVSTHDLDLALQMTDSLWVMDKGVVHVGTAQELAHHHILSQTFHSDRVRFNADTMRFEWVSPRVKS